MLVQNDTPENGEVKMSMQSEETQFSAIRDLMLEASRRGAWLTLAEIAESTEFGEASISAQLRHMRKRRFGNYRVDNRRREAPGAEPSGVADAVCADATMPGEPVARRGIACRSEQWESRRPDAHGNVAPWEYRAFAQPLRSGELYFEGAAEMSAQA
jgi:hypothetical protein